MNEVDFSVKTYKPVGVISKLEQHKILWQCALVAITSVMLGYFFLFIFL